MTLHSTGASGVDCGDEVEARWAAPVCHPGHCPSQGLHIHEAYPAKSTVMELEPHGRDALPVHGRQSEISVVLGDQLSLAPTITPWQDTLPAVHSSFRQGQSMMCSREG